MATLTAPRTPTLACARLGMKLRTVTAPPFLGGATSIILGTNVSATSSSFISGPDVTFGFGILNLGNAYPDKIVDRALSQGGSIQYPAGGGVGTNGREYFARASINF